MKTLENVTLYKCDFCGKELKRKYAMENHETRCNCNPENHRYCLAGCKHLTQKEIEYYSGIDDYHSGEPLNKTGTTFYCELKQQFMLHPKLQFRRGGSNLENVYFEDEEVEQVWMPKECKEYNDNIFNF